MAAGRSQRVAPRPTALLAVLHRPRSRARAAFRRICAALWRWGWLFWVPITLQALAGLAFSVLIAPPSWLSDLRHSPIGWLWTHPVTALAGFGALLLLTVVVYLGSHPRGTRRHGEIGRQYLVRVIREHEAIALTGIPAKLISESVRLDAVFVPLTFWPARPLTDYPLDVDEIDVLRRRRLLSEDAERDVDRILLDAERSWHRLLSRGSRSTFAEVWSHLTPGRPTLVVQGFPGTGKSTLLARLALHMARRCLGDLDTLPSAPQPTAVPLFVQLREFADARTRDPQLGLWPFIEQTVRRWGIADVCAFLDSALRRGHCLVLMDGLDEISAVQDRRAVQDEITRFIRNYSSAPDALLFNRFLITSRIAGYDQHAFPAAAHVTIAELDLEQIDSFLNQWNTAIQEHDPERRLVDPEHAVALAQRKAARQTSRLRELIDSQPALLELATNPLLLALLVVMQHNDVPVPLRRSEIYRTIVRTMLEDRNYASQLPIVGEQEAVALLGPLAAHMQRAGNNLAHRPRVLAMVNDALRTNAGPNVPISAVDNFLDLVRERGGIFARRTDEHYGFSHRIFQEYFAARHLLSRVIADPDTEVDRLVELARQQDELWREPFVLAVAYAGDEPDGDLVDRILSRLLAGSGPGLGSGIDAAGDTDVMLAAECLVDLPRSSVSQRLERLICVRLLEAYDRSYRKRVWQHCSRIEETAHRLLLSVHRKGHRSAFNQVLYEAVIRDGELLRSATWLLCMIAGEIAYQSDAPLLPFVPVLMGRAGLPSAAEHAPLDSVGQAPHDVIDLSVTVLSMLGPRGPAGAMLPGVRDYFALHPRSLERIAQVSLASGSLLTPTVAPVRVEANERYRWAVGQWRGLLSNAEMGRLTNRQVSAAVDIQDELLSTADQVRYPISSTFVDMFDRLAGVFQHDWAAACMRFLHEELGDDDYIRYRAAAMLWTAIFPDHASQQQLAAVLQRHFGATGTGRQVFAQRYISMLCEDKRLPQYERYLSQLLSKFNRDRQLVHSPEDLRDLYRLRDLQALRGLEYTRFTRFMAYLGYLRSCRGLHYMMGARTLRPIVSTAETARIAVERLAECLAKTAEPYQYLDLLVILRDWVDRCGCGGAATDGEPYTLGPATVCEALGDVLLAVNDREVTESALLVLEACVLAHPALRTYPAALSHRVTHPTVREQLLRLADRHGTRAEENPRAPALQGTLEEVDLDDPTDDRPGRVEDEKHARRTAP